MLRVISNITPHTYSVIAFFIREVRCPRSHSSHKLNSNRGGFGSRACPANHHDIITVIIIIIVLSLELHPSLSSSIHSLTPQILSVYHLCSRLCIRHLQHASTEATGTSARLKSSPSCKGGASLLLLAQGPISIDIRYFWSTQGPSPCSPLVLLRLQCCNLQSSSCQVRQRAHDKTGALGELSLLGLDRSMYEMGMRMARGRSPRKCGVGGRQLTELSWAVLVSSLHLLFLSPHPSASGDCWEPCPASALWWDVGRPPECGWLMVPVDEKG